MQTLSGTIVLTVLLAASAVWAAGPASAPDAAAIPANTWLDAKLTYQLPRDLPDASWSTTDGYCGSVYRSKTGTILFRSGVQSKQAGLSPGFYSNALLEWNLAGNIVRVLDVANWGGGSYGGGKLLPAFATRPTPTPRHTYDGLAYVPEEDALYLMLGANWRIGTNATDEAKAAMAVDNKSTWKYTFADGRWTRIDDSIRKVWPGEAAVSPYESHMRHWPAGGKLLFLNDRGSNYAEFDLAKQVWEKVELKNRCPMSLYNARSTWDSKRQLWVFRLGPKLCTFDPKTKEFVAPPDAFPMPTYEKDPARSAKGVAYIPKHDVYLIAGPTGNDTYVYAVEAGKWTQVRGGDIKLVNGYLEYDPRTDQVGMVYQHSAYKFRFVLK